MLPRSESSKKPWSRLLACTAGTCTPAAANSAALLFGGAVAFVQDKMLLPTYDVFDEARYFSPAQQQKVWPFCGRQWALTICEDVWWPEAPAMAKAARISASWRKARAARSR